ncbi:MAG: hypothetical protein ACTSU2_09895 [Promethearchaeota archaeon]
MPKNVKDKLMNIVSFLRDSVIQVSNDVEELDKSLNSFLKTLSKAQKDLKGIKIGKNMTATEATAVPTKGRSSKKGSSVNVKEKAASTLLSMLSGNKAGVESSGSSRPSIPSFGGGAPPSAKSSAGVPSGPPSNVGPPMKSKLPAPPTKPGAPSGLPKPPTKPGAAGAPPPPKLPPAPGSKGAGVPPVGAVKKPSFVKGASPITPPPMKPGAAPPSPPAAPSAPSAPPAPSGPPRPPGAGAPGATAQPALGSLKNEMLKELVRLKKIMKGNNA